MFGISSFFNYPRRTGRLVQVEFGNPKKRDCAGLGICNVEMIGHQRLTKRPCCEHCKATAYLTYVRRDNEIVLHFRRADLTDKAFARHFKDGVFRVEEDFFLPSSVARACGLPRNAVLPRGRYHLRGSEGHLQVSFLHSPAPSLALPMHSLPHLRPDF